MSVETTAAQTVNKRNGLWGLAESWLEPKSKDRDEAFRERSIRVAIAIVILLGLISFIMTIFVYRNDWGLISLPTLHIIILVGFFSAAATVARNQVNAAALLVVATALIAASGLLILRGTQASLDVLITGIPLFMFVVMVTPLVMARNAILPISVVAVVLYIISIYSANNAFAVLPSLDLTQAVSASIVLLIPEGIILHRLRVEFDARLDAMRDSIRRAELAQQQAEEARRQAENDRKRAEESDKAKSQFLANMSHELRTPLNAIIGYDEAMLGGLAGEFSTQQTKLLGHIQFNSRRLLGLINDILDLSKIESGSLQVFLAPMSPRKVIEDVVENLRSLADEKKIDLKVQFSESVPEVVLGDTNKLQQILTNLLSNAIKFTNHGGVVVDVGIVDGSHWQFQVRDTGIGMPPNAATYIFEPFQQVDNTDQRKYKGTGLGLAITNRLIKSLNGTIEVETKLGEGSTFSVKLPRTHIPGETNEPEQAQTVETTP